MPNEAAWGVTALLKAIVAASPEPPRTARMKGPKVPANGTADLAPFRAVEEGP